jgi:putative FmdB family regulatory protein
MRQAEQTMPLYDFRCSRCREAYELFLSIDEPETICCPDCGGELEVLLFNQVPLLPLASLPFPRSVWREQEPRETAAHMGESSSSGKAEL